MKPWLLRFAGVPYLADPNTQQLYRVATDRPAKTPQTAIDSQRLRRAELKRRRKGAARLLADTENA